MEVLNKHTASNEDLQNSVYIGRGSPLGNPYPVGEEHGNNEEVVQKYRKYLAQKLISRDPKIENAIRSLSPDSRLVCFCKPKPCHGDVVKEFYYELHNGTDYDHALRSFKEKHNLDRLDYYPEDDGVTHINVWSKAKTPLGRSLSNFAHTPFDHPIHGRFSSVEGFWYWLSTGGTRNELRSVYGFQSKKLGRLIREELEKAGGIPIVEDFEAQIKKALLCKIEQNNTLKETLKNSDLPLTHYYVWGEPPNVKVTVPDSYSWIHEYLSDVRDWLNGKAYKLVIAGSRSIKELSLVETAYNQAHIKAIEIVSGCAPGVDRLGEELAKKLYLPIERFPADWDNKGKAAGHIRNGQMAKYADAGLLVWDGVSPGTQSMIKQLEMLNKPYFLSKVNV